MSGGAVVDVVDGGDENEEENDENGSSVVAVVDVGLVASDADDPSLWRKATSAAMNDTAATRANRAMAR
jgi:hypothetical protein